MATFVVPSIGPDDHKISVWPTLGDQVIAHMETWNVWGPGSKLGRPVEEVDPEFAAWLRRVYQVYPKGHDYEGRRRFDFGALELVKGVGKTERAIQVAQVEIDPEGPIRTVDWERRGRYWQPIGGPVDYARLIFLATTEAQVLRTAFGRFVATMKRSPRADRYHVTAEKVVRLGPDGSSTGEAYPLPISPDSADGDLPTWQHVDEPHRWEDLRHHEMLTTIEENTTKDPSADAWTMSTSTAGRPGAGSVEEDLLHTAEAIDRGELNNPRMFFFRRYVPDEAPLDTEADLVAAIREARGPAIAHSGDIPRIVSRWWHPKTDRAYFRRVQFNQWWKDEARAFDPNAWADADRPGAAIPAGAFVALGFDGARRYDSTAIVATDIETGVQVLLGLWERPAELGPDDEWEVDEQLVTDTLDAAFELYDVYGAWCDPPHWRDQVIAWEGLYGDDRVLRFETANRNKMVAALATYATAIRTGELGHDGDARLARHIANAYKSPLPRRSDEDEERFLIRKEYPGSPNKIDAAVAGCLSWYGRSVAVTKGARPRRKARPAAFSFS